MTDAATTTADAKSSRDKPPRRRRSLIWRIVKWTLLILLILIVIILGLVAWVAGTRSGLDFAWGQIGPRLPEGIEIGSVEGRLIGPLEVRGVKYDTDTMHVAVKAVDFDWTAKELLSATVHVKNLAVRGVDYEVKKVAQAPPEPPPSNEPFSLPDAIDLPVTVQIDKVSLDDLSAVTAPKAKAFVVNTVRLTNARLDGKDWKIESLTGHGPMFDIDADAKLNPRGRYATNLNLTAALRLPDLAPVKAKAAINGDLSDLKLKADVDAPYNLAVDGSVADALDKPKLDATVKLDDTRLQAIKKDLPKVAVTTTVGAKGPIDNLAVTLDTNADSADFGKAAISALVHYTPAAVIINRLKLTSSDMPGNLTAKGQVALAEGNAMDLTVDWSKLQWPIKGKPAYRSDNGTVKLTGEMSDYKLATDLAWQVIGQTEGKLSLNGNGTMKSFDLAKLNISGGPGDISGNAKVVWAPALDVDAHIEGKGINPGAVVADVPGDFDLVADVTAKQQDKLITAVVKKLTANGTLRGQPLKLDAKAQYLGDHVLVDKFDLVSGATSADVSGRFGWTPDAKLDGRWAIDSSDLSTAWPTLAGRLNTKGTVKGQVAAPTVKATLDANNVAFAENRVNRANLDANVDWSGNTQSKVDLNVRGVDAGGQAIRTVTLNLDGTPARHKLALNLDSDIAQANLGMDGQLDKKNYRERFTLNELRAAYQELAPWMLASPASGAVSADAQSLDDACLTSGGARVCITGSHDAKASVAHIKLSDFAYDYAKTYFPEGLGVTGAVSGTVDANLPTGGNPDVNADLRTAAGRVTMAGADDNPVQVLDMQPGKITARMRNNGLDANVDLPLAGSRGIQASAEVAPGSGALTTHSLDGRVQLGLASLEFIEKLSPEVATFDGGISGDMRLNGTLAEPNIRGRIGLDAPKIVLVTPGLRLTDVNLAAVGRGNTIDVTAAAQSGGGNLNVDGNIALNKNGQDVELAIKGDRFQVVHIPDATAYASPDLQVKVTPARVDVNGSVTIPEASITPRDLPASGVTTVSGDQVIVSDDGQAGGAPAAAAREIYANVKVILGDKVRVEAFGLKANLQGDLRVVQEPGNVPTGSGAINIVNGAYKAYGQNLDIQEGQILFAGGPVSEPGLDIKAARYPNEDTTVGVHVRGTLKKPQLTIFSEPSMSQSEQLSWLLLGRPLGGASGQQSSMVARAAMALGSSKGNQYLQGLGNKVGLDDVGVGAPPGEGGAGQDSDAGAALTVGKYLSPKLYVSYGLGLFDPVSTLSMRYTLSSRWQLETQSSGKATGGDIIYSIDR